MNQQPEKSSAHYYELVDTSSPTELWATRDPIELHENSAPIQELHAATRPLEIMGSEIPSELAASDPQRASADGHFGHFEHEHQCSEAELRLQAVNHLSDHHMVDQHSHFRPAGTAGLYSHAISPITPGSGALPTYSTQPDDISPISETNPDPILHSPSGQFSPSFPYAFVPPQHYHPQFSVPTTATTPSQYTAGSGSYGVFPGLYDNTHGRRILSPSTSVSRTTHSPHRHPAPNWQGLGPSMMEQNYPHDEYTGPMIHPGNLGTLQGSEIFQDTIRDVGHSMEAPNPSLYPPTIDYDGQEVIDQPVPSPTTPRNRLRRHDRAHVDTNPFPDCFCPECNTRFTGR